MSEVLVETDRVPMALVRHAQIPQGSTGTVSVTFTIPTEQVFWGQRLELIPQVRSVPLDGTTAARVWNRASWTVEQGSFPASVYSAAIDVLWRISSSVDGVSYEYQNAPCSIPACFGASPYRWSQGAFPSALTFDQEWYLPGGSSLNLALTPTYTDLAVAPDFYMYRIVGILSGTKEVS